MGLAMTDEEWDNLLEYLAGPADSPYGAKRVRHGQSESWLKTFDTVYLELGDEVWNSNRAPWSLDDPARYAAWARASSAGSRTASITARRSAWWPVVTPATQSGMKRC